jgi:ribosomal protein L22
MSDTPDKKADEAAEKAVEAAAAAETAADESPTPETVEAAVAAEEAADVAVEAAAEADAQAEETAAKPKPARKPRAKKAAASTDEADAKPKPKPAPKPRAKAAPKAEADDAVAEVDAPVADEPPADEAPKPGKPARTAPARRRDRRREAPAGVEVRAQAKYVRTSARKARLVCDHIRGKDVAQARAILAFTPRAAAKDWAKLLESAVANAEHNHELVGDELKIASIHADEGPTLKRYRPRAMGRATRIRKRTSHLTITLTPKE